MTQIRPARREDIPAVVELMKRHYDEHEFSFRFDPARLSVTLAHAINSDDWLCLTGSGALLLASTYDSPLGAGRLAVEHIVRAARPGQFSELLGLYERWARERGCTSIALACVRKPDLFARLYGRHGFRPSETVFVKAI